MSSTSPSRNVPADEPSTRHTLVEPAAEAEPPDDDELPFESPEFGVGAFFPHVDARSDG